MFNLRKITYTKDANEFLKAGNIVKVSGILDEFNGLKQISSGKGDVVVEKVGTSTLPEPKEIAADKIGEEYESQLIKVKNLTITNVTGSDTNGYDITAEDKNKKIVNLRVDKVLASSIKPQEYKLNSIIDVIAPLSEFTRKGAAPNYQLMIRTTEDIKVIKEGDGTVPGTEVAKIREIQGKIHRSPLENKGVSGVTGIVTAISNDKYQKGFFMQDPNPDDDPATSEGIFVKYSNNSVVKVGDSVTVAGTVKEVVNGTNEDGLPETQIAATTVKVESSGNKLPEAKVINLTGKLLYNVDDDKLADFQIDDDAIDYFESLEGMLVEIKDPLIVGADERYGEIYVVPNNGVGSEDQLTPRGGIKALANDFNPEVITIDDIIHPIVGSDNKYIDKNMKIKTGDKFKDSSLVGIMSYGFGKFKILNTEKLPDIIPGNTEREVTIIGQQENKLTVASYNIENFNALDLKKVNDIADNIVTNLKSPDIIGLVEVQDNDGETQSSDTDASKNYQALIDAIKAKNGIEYGFTDVAPVNGEDGGAPGANIRQGFIYRKDRVSLVNKTKGDAVTAVKATSEGLSVNPGRIDPTNEAFKNSRKPLAAEFDFRGKKVIVIANHLNSKRGDGSLFGINQPPVNGSEPQRHKQAAIINSFIKDINNYLPDANVVALGDMNDYEFSETIRILKGNEMKNMIDKLPENERYTYVYSGNSQVLDNVLVSNKLYDSADVDVVHINSEFTEGYGRVSDHDPVLIQLDLGLKGFTDEEAVEFEKNKLDLGDLSSVSNDLILPTKLGNGVTVSWESSDESAISNEGKVTTSKEAKVVELTAVLSKGSYSDNKEFNVNVVSDADILKVAEEKLSIAEDLSKVTSNLTLPTLLENGVTVSWESSDTNVISTDGKVTRPEFGQGNKEVTLTATLTKGEATSKKEFKITVIEKQENQQGNVIFEEKFDDISTWSDSKIDGTGMFDSSLKKFVKGTTAGVQKGEGNIVLLKTSKIEGWFSIKLDLTGKNDLKLSFDWSKIANTPPESDNRVSILKVQYSLDGTNFKDITGKEVKFTNNNDSESGSEVFNLPSELSTQNVILKFDVQDVGGGGNRPKVALDNIVISATN